VIILKFPKEICTSLILDPCVFEVLIDKEVTLLIRCCSSQIFQSRIQITRTTEFSKGNTIHSIKNRAFSFFSL
jgi:hypothetical protein